MFTGSIVCIVFTVFIAIMFPTRSNVIEMKNEKVSPKKKKSDLDFFLFFFFFDQMKTALITKISNSPLHFILQLIVFFSEH